MVYKYLGEWKTALKFYRLTLRHSNHCLTGRERDDFLANLYHNRGGLEHSRRCFRRGELYARKSLLLRRRAQPRALPLAADKVALAAILDGLTQIQRVAEIIPAGFESLPADLWTEPSGNRADFKQSCRGISANGTP
jgi:hypothetical protein